MKQKVFLIVAIILFYILIYCIEIKSIKNRKIRNMMELLILIIFIPGIIILFDIWNYFEKFMPDIYHSITEKYDMLAFLGTYISAVVSSIILLIITSIDREENTRIIQEAQRPYLDIRYPKLSNKFIKEHKGESTVFYHRIDKMREELVKEYICLEIINTGESVAIIDVNNIKIEIQYADIKEKEEEKMMRTIRPKINTGLPRLSLGKGESIYIIFLCWKFYNDSRILDDTKIIYTNIEYKDLFNSKYIDECGRNEKGEQIVLKDNKKK